MHDFNDYIQVVNLCGNAIEMWHEDFYDFRNYKSNRMEKNYLLIADISVVKFWKNDTRIYWKTSFEESELKSGHFLAKEIAWLFQKKVIAKKERESAKCHQGKEWWYFEETFKFNVWELSEVLRNTPRKFRQLEFVN